MNGGVSKSSLSVAWHDPTCADAPAEWSKFVTAYQLLPVWDWAIIHAYAITSRPAVLAATVHSDSQVVALATARFVGPRTGRGAVPLMGLVDVDCLASSAMPGLALSDPDDPELLAEVLVALRAGLRQRFGVRVRGMMLRQIGSDWLPTVLRWPAVVRQGGPIGVFHNNFDDFDAYLATLRRTRRQSLRKLLHELDTDPGVRMAYTGHGDQPGPLTATEVCDLVNQVVDRHHTRWWLRKRYKTLELATAELAHPRTERLTYHDAEGRLLAYVLVGDHDRMPLLGTWGAPSLADGGRKGLWFHFQAVLIRWCIDTGREGLIAGQGSSEEKRRMGYRLHPQWAVLIPQ
jgi:hypothetical protein